jgi:hypothetical protein
VKWNIDNNDHQFVGERQFNAKVLLTLKASSIRFARITRAAVIWTRSGVVFSNNSPPVTK